MACFCALLKKNKERCIKGRYCINILDMELTVLILHILGAGVLLGLVVLSAVIVFLNGLSEAMLKILEKTRWLGPGFSLWMLLTGAALYSFEPEEFRQSKIFWTKIGLYVVEGLVAALVIDAKIKREKAAGVDVVSTAKKLRWAYVVHASLIIAIIALAVIMVETH